MRLKRFLVALLSITFVLPFFSITSLADSYEDSWMEDNFPSEDFRNFLLSDTTINPNGDRYLSYDERANVTDIVISGEDALTLSDFRGLEYFPNLKSFSLINANTGHRGFGIYLKDNDKLETINLSGSKDVDRLYIGSKADLFILDISNTNISSIGIANCPRLYYLNAVGSRLSEVYIGDNELLMNAYNYNEISPVDPSNPVYQYQYMRINVNPSTVLQTTPPAGTIHIDETNFPSAGLRRALRYNSWGYDNLLTEDEILRINTLEIRTVSTTPENLKGIELFENLTHLYISGNIDQNTLDLSNSSKLRELSLFCPNVTAVDITNCPGIKYLAAFYTNISVMNISGNTLLLDLYNNPHEQYYNDEGDIYQYDIYRRNGSSTLMFLKPGCTVDTNPPVTPIITRPTTIPSNNPTPTGNPAGNPTSNPTNVPTGTTTTAPTTRPTVAPTTRPTNNPTQAPAQTPVSESGVGGFVERLYTIALDRNSDPNGKADWVNRVYTQGATGADVAQGFLFSPEFIEKDMSNEDFLAVLYRVFFDRVGDPAGIEYWSTNMANGMDKQTVIWGFINSTEWANVCLRYGINSGGNGVPNITIEPAPEIIEFATRLYTTCLGRAADQNGLMDWATQLANRQISGSQAAAGFFTSGEFVDANYSNDEYINRLYRTFMGREADQGGFDYWMSQFAQGATREDVFNGFAGSAEWAEICSSYGILK